MSRSGYPKVYRNGRLVSKATAGPLIRSEDAHLHIISDGIEFKSMADGKMYTSKSRYRSDLRARGLVEVGTDTSWKRNQGDAYARTGGGDDIKSDIRQSIEKLSNR